jgi:hypothetical protein
MCNRSVVIAWAWVILAFIGNGILKDVQILGSKNLKAVVVNSTQFQDARASAEQFAAWALKEQKVLGTPLSLVCAGFVIALIMLCSLLVLHKCPQLIRRARKLFGCAAAPPPVDVSATTADGGEQHIDAAGAGGVAMVRGLSSLCGSESFFYFFLFCIYICD